MPSPARKISFRLSVSTAGFEGEGSPLRDLYERAQTFGTEIAPELYTHENLLCFWSHDPNLAPWQSDAWVSEMRRTLRGSQFQRLILNQWVSSESNFVELAEWDACVDLSLKPIIASKSLPVFIGLDLGLRHDATAIVTVAEVNGSVQLIDHRIFVPRDGETLDIERTAEDTLRGLRNRFNIRSIYLDPWQTISTIQRLKALGFPMVDYNQVSENQTKMASNLLDLIKARRLTMYPSEELRTACVKTVAIETARGWRLGKTKASNRIDPIVAMAMACMALADKRGVGGSMEVYSLLSGVRLSKVAPDGGLLGDVGFTDADGRLLRSLDHA